MKLNTVNEGSAVEGVDSVFGAEYNPSLVHQAVVAYLSAARQGSVAQKSRSAVNGGGAKPWRQKGTGRARAGTIRSPLWRSGGVTFASSPRSYQQKLNKKMYRSAMRSILSELVRGDRLVVMESFGFSEAKTKLLVDALGGLGVDCRMQNVLLVLSEVNDAVRLASRNLEKVEVLSVKNVNPVSLVRSDKVLFEIDALKQLEGALT